MKQSALRRLGYCHLSEDLETTVYRGIFVHLWVDKQVQPVAIENFFQVLHDAGREVIAMSPALTRCVEEREDYEKRIRETKRVEGEDVVADLAREIVDQYDEAWRISDMRAPTAYGW